MYVLRNIVLLVSYYMYLNFTSLWANKINSLSLATLS